MAPQREWQLGLSDPAAVIRDLNPGIPAVPDLDAYRPDPGQAAVVNRILLGGYGNSSPRQHSVDRVLEQLLDRIPRAGDDLARGNLRYDLVLELTYRHRATRGHGIDRHVSARA